MFLATSGAALADAASDQLLTKALQTSMVEVELGKLAQKNAESTGVNALGDRLRRDHARIGKILAAISRDRGLVVPVALNSTQREQVDALNAKRGVGFDAAYVELMVANHENAVTLFTALSQSADPQLSQFAKRALPVLREDQRLAGSYEKLNPPSTDAVQAVAQK